MIDEVRVYDRVLTPDEVIQNFEAKSNRIAVESNGKLAATWGDIKQN